MLAPFRESVKLRLAKRALGQNFLVDPWIIQEILAAIQPQPTDHMVEIGPGLGALTLFLAGRTKRLDLIELDSELVHLLKRQPSLQQDNIRIYEADALGFDWKTLLEESTDDRLRLVGNLPYNISTPLLIRFCQQANLWIDLHLMFQKEVGERITASVGSPHYGRLSILAQSLFQIRTLLTISPSAFMPAPKVFSQCLLLAVQPFTQTRLLYLNELQVVTQHAFRCRRKQIKNNLIPLFSYEELAMLNIQTTQRAQELEVTDFLNLAKRLKQRSKPIRS